MDCRGWCAAGGLLVMFPLLRSAETSAAQSMNLSMPWWYWLIFFGLALLAIGWWVLSLRPGTQRDVQALESQLEHEHEHEMHDHPSPAQVKVAAPEAGNAPPENLESADVSASSVTELVPDDLTRIEGIGPKIASLLQEAGLHTFGQLAEAEVERLETLLEANRLGTHDPATWPQQAALANAGDWDGLQSLQDRLKAGRKQDDKPA